MNSDKRIYPASLPPAAPRRVGAMFGMYLIKTVNPARRYRGHVVHVPASRTCCAIVTDL